MSVVLMRNSWKEKKVLIEFIKSTSEVSRKPPQRLAKWVPFVRLATYMRGKDILHVHVYLLQAVLTNHSASYTTNDTDHHQSA